MINARQEIILKDLISDYIETARPVASSRLVDNFGISVSPATVRNDMVDLEYQGYLEKPHISGGRIPTTKGYHYYVSNLLDGDNETSHEEEVIEKEVEKFSRTFDGFLLRLGELISDITSEMSIMGFSDRDIHHFGMSRILSQPEFTDIHKTQELALLIDSLSKFHNQLTKKALEKLSEFSIADEEKKTLVFIGHMPFFQEKEIDCSVVLGRYFGPQGRQGIVGILGPRRMKYSRNKSLVAFVSRLISGTVAIFIVTIII